jgi:hypothetical protein
VPLVYYVFDLLFLNGKDLRKEPLLARLKLLATVSRKRPKTFGFPKGCMALRRTCYGLPRSLALKASSPSA